MKFGFGYGGSYESGSSFSKLNSTKPAEKTKSAKAEPTKRSSNGRVSNTGKVRTTKSSTGTGVSDKAESADTKTRKPRKQSSGVSKAEPKKELSGGHNNSESKSENVARTTKKCDKPISVKPKKKKKIVGKELPTKQAAKIFKWFDENKDYRLIVSLMFDYSKIIRVLEQHQNEVICNLDGEHILVNFKTKKVTNFGKVWESGIDTKNDVPWTEKDDRSKVEESNKG